MAGRNFLILAGAFATLVVGSVVELRSAPGFVPGMHHRKLPEVASQPVSEHKNSNRTMPPAMADYGALLLTYGFGLALGWLIWGRGVRGR